MSHLVPCPSCARHVRHIEATCPFCSAMLSLAEVPAPALPRSRLGRAATFAFGAGLVGAASLVACGGDSEGGKDGGGSGTGGASAGTASGGASAGTASGGTSAGTASGGTSAGTFGMGGNIAQPYGVPPIGGEGPVYGAPPGGNGGGGVAAGGEANAGSAGGPVPPYGAPPPK